MSTPETIYVAGHRGMVGSVSVRQLLAGELSGHSIRPGAGAKTLHGITGHRRNGISRIQHRLHMEH